MKPKPSIAKTKAAPDTPGNYCYRYPHAALTADCVVFGFDGERLCLLLVERGGEPYKGMWALPGGFMRIDETIEETARRELLEETGLHHVYLDQFKVYSTVDRDPRERVVTVAFIALVRQQDVMRPIAGDDAANAAWFDESELPPLAFDHAEIIAEARERLKEILRVRPVAFELLDANFTLPELQKVYEIINRTSYDRRNFQRKLMQSDLITESGSVRNTGASRPAKLFAKSARPSGHGGEGLFSRLKRACAGKAEECDDGCLPMATEEPKTRCSSSRRAPEEDETSTGKGSKDEGSIKDLFNF